MEHGGGTWRCGGGDELMNEVEAVLEHVGDEACQMR